MGWAKYDEDNRDDTVVFLFQLAVQAVDLPLKRLALLTALANLRLQPFVMRLLIVLNDGGHGTDDSGFARARIGDDEHIQAGLLVVSRVTLHPDLALQASGEHAERDPGGHVHRRLRVLRDGGNVGLQSQRQAMNRECGQRVCAGRERDIGVEQARSLPGVRDGVFSVFRVCSGLDEVQTI